MVNCQHYFEDLYKNSYKHAMYSLAVYASLQFFAVLSAVVLFIVKLFT